MHDGWPAYQYYHQCRHALRGAHLLRELTYVEESSPRQRGQEQFRRRYEALLRRGLELNPERTRPPGGGWRGRGERGRVAQTAARKLAARLERCQPEVLRFMADFSAPFENNQAERDLRMVRLQQKIGGCFRTGEGAREFCRLRGVTSTARKQGHGVLDSIERVLRGQSIPLTS